ncbi:hypothetical protein CW713_06995 [Methanophagales archaeon]|nr:MAG: hypothetical protein CW713_06995 [Methanophagales archaeon]
MKQLKFSDYLPKDEEKTFEDREFFNQEPKTVLVGVLKNIRTINTKFGETKVIDMDVERYGNYETEQPLAYKEKITMVVNTVLDRLLRDKKVEIGNRIAVIYHGMVNGKKSRYKNYSLTILD